MAALSASSIRVPDLLKPSSYIISRNKSSSVRRSVSDSIQRARSTSCRWWKSAMLSYPYVPLLGTLGRGPRSGDESPAGLLGDDSEAGGGSPLSDARTASFHVEHPSTRSQPCRVQPPGSETTQSTKYGGSANPCFLAPAGAVDHGRGRWAAE